MHVLVGSGFSVARGTWEREGSVAAGAVVASAPAPAVLAAGCCDTDICAGLAWPGLAVHAGGVL